MVRKTMPQSDRKRKRLYNNIVITVLVLVVGAVLLVGGITHGLSANEQTKYKVVSNYVPSDADVTPTPMYELSQNRSWLIEEAMGADDEGSSFFTSSSVTIHRYRDVTPMERSPIKISGSTLAVSIEDVGSSLSLGDNFIRFVAPIAGIALLLTGLKGVTSIYDKLETA